MFNFIFVFIAFVAPIGAIGNCYTPGPSFPQADRILNKTHFTQLAAQLDERVRSIWQTTPGWETNITSFALQVTSNEEAIWGYYHTAPILGEYKDSYPTPVSGDTAFRIASITKTFTVYALLLDSKINVEDPITKYIPELRQRDEVEPFAWNTPHWDNITIRSLASQLSGIARETGLSDLAVDTTLLPDPLANGFPPVDEKWLAPCMKNSTDRACNASEIIQVARSRSSVFLPNERPSYSNVAFSLLGIALERATGKTYSDILSSYILDPLDMTNTQLSKPKDSAGIIPYGPNDWAQELGADNPSGGLYVTANDCSKFLRSILSSQLLPVSTINAWMKPHSWTSGSHSAYGMPWEILRTTRLTPDGRGIDIVTKGGALTGYFSTIALIPEFGLGVTIFVAGDQKALFELREAIVSTLITATEMLIQNEARSIYAGKYADFEEWLEPSPPNMDFSLSLEVDDHGPGIRVLDWVSNRTHFLPVYGALKGMPNDPTKWEARLLPTDVREPLEFGGDVREIVKAEIWRLTAIPKRNPADENKVFDDYCMTDVDALMYDGFSIEEFLLVKVPFFGDDGYLQAGVLANAGMRFTMLKYEDSQGNVIGETMRFQKAGSSFAKFKNQQMPMTFM